MEKKFELNDVANELFILDNNTVNKLFEISPEAFALYGFYYNTAKWQKNSNPWATNEYVAKKLNWSLLKVKKTKQLLTQSGMISQKRIVDDKGKVIKWVICLNYIKNPTGTKTHPVDLPTGTKTQRVDNDTTYTSNNKISQNNNNINNNIINNNINNINNNNNNNIYTSNKLDKSEILSLWNRLAEKWGFSKISIVSDERQQKIKARLKDSGCETLYEMFKMIDEAIMGSLFLRGKKQRRVNGEWVLENADWRPDFDFFTRKSKFIKAIDGGYDDNDVIEKKNEGKWEQYKNWMNKNWGEF